MILESLLLSQDAELLPVIQATLEKLSIEVHLCPNARVGADKLSSEKFDAVIVDCDDLAGGLDILKTLRDTRSNKNSVAFAILNGKETSTQEAFGMGANFVLQKPITLVNASRCFHAALNFMLKERRRYFRQPLNMQVEVIVEGKPLPATATNISEGGIALILRENLPKGVMPRLKFFLPCTDIPIELDAEMAWANMKGVAGFRFQNAPKEIQQQLEHWLDARIEEGFPGARERMAAAEAHAAESNFQPHAAGKLTPPDFRP